LFRPVLFFCFVDDLRAGSELLMSTRTLSVRDDLIAAARDLDRPAIYRGRYVASGEPRRVTVRSGVRRRDQDLARFLPRPLGSHEELGSHIFDDGEAHRTRAAADAPDQVWRRSAAMERPEHGPQLEGHSR
jgi:hypothetical protein